jgi:methyltransferase (TIGR00027 family)
MLETTHFPASALATARFRAAHQKVDRPLVFTDSIALKFLGLNETELSKLPEAQKDPLTSALRISVAVRSKYCENALEKAIEKGVSQYVILGAGMDSHAYRTQHKQLQIFEVDLAHMQEHKRKSLEQHAISSTAQITYIKCDFEKDNLQDLLTSTLHKFL